MIYTIKGEQPFQVLNDSFSVSPSESGYDLYISADGFNYSNFATVASGVTRQFTGMNEGNYYILSGNTSEVKVNWMKDCGGGGGGSAAGVSSLDGQTGALTTKTINGNAILGSGDIEIGGGGSEVSYSQTLTAGTEIGEITIDGSATTIYAPSAETGNSPIVVDLDALTQQERSALINELSGSTSADTVNEKYTFFASFDDGKHQIRLQFAGAFSYISENDSLGFSATIPSPTHNNRVQLYIANILGDGGYSKNAYGYGLANLDNWGRIHTFCAVEDSSGNITISDSSINNIAWNIESGRAWYADGDGMAYQDTFGFNMLDANDDCFAFGPLYVYSSGAIKNHSWFGVFNYFDKTGAEWRVKFEWSNSTVSNITKTSI